ncbi:MAG: epimerase [Bryobacteraceae bacterium]
MRVVLFGSTSMVGQGVLRECLLDPDVEGVLSIVRSASGQQHEKLHELVHEDFFDFSNVDDKISGYDACFFCLGVSSAGMKEEDYRRVTYDLTMAAAQALVARNPNMTFIYVSGAGTDSSEQGRIMWARVKGKTENALLRLPFKATYMFRPGFIQPLHGIKSRTGLYRALYSLTGPFYPLSKTIAPRLVMTTEQVGRAMIKVAKQGAPKQLLENQDIRILSADGDGPPADLRSE